MVQQVKDLVVSLQWLGLLLWSGFDPWPGNSHMPWAWLKKKRSVKLGRRKEKSSGAQYGA